MTKKIGVAVDFSSSSKRALSWAAENLLLNSGDYLVLLHVVTGAPDPEGKQALWAKSGSPLVPLAEFREPAVMKQYDLQPDSDVLDLLETVAREKKATVVAKIYWGDAREKLCEAVDDLELNSIVMGSRGLGPLKRILLGSVTNYVLSNAPCPVTIIKDPKDVPSKH